jgi:hypothetical protein
MATTEHAGPFRVAPSGHTTKANYRRSRGRAGHPQARTDGSPGKRQRVAHIQQEVCGIPSVPKGVVGIQADIPRAREGRVSMSQPQGKESGQQRQDPGE